MNDRIEHGEKSLSSTESLFHKKVKLRKKEDNRNMENSLSSSLNSPHEDQGKSLEDMTSSVQKKISEENSFKLHRANSNLLKPFWG